MKLRIAKKILKNRNAYKNIQGVKAFKRYQQKVNSAIKKGYIEIFHETQYFCYMRLVKFEKLEDALITEMKYLKKKYPAYFAKNYSRYEKNEYEKCPSCGNVNLTIAGSCKTCTTCGESSGGCG